MQVVFAPQRKFFATRVTAVTPRRAAVERRDMRKSHMESAFIASRARAASAPRLGRSAERPREIVKTRRRC